jgi:hypothetical protein
MAAAPETRFQLSIKTPSGALINLYATDFTEFGEELDALETLASKISAAEGLFVAASAVAPVAAPPSQQTAPAAAPAAPAAAPGNGPVCNCGQPAKLVPAGVSKASGKPYRAFYACNGPRDTQCDFRLTA